MMNNDYKTTDIKQQYLLLEKTDINDDQHLYKTTDWSEQHISRKRLSVMMTNTSTKILTVVSNIPAERLVVSNIPLERLTVTKITD